MDIPNYSNLCICCSAQNTFPIYIFCLDIFQFIYCVHVFQRGEKKDPNENSVIQIKATYGCIFWFMFTRADVSGNRNTFMDELHIKFGGEGSYQQIQINFIVDKCQAMHLYNWALNKTHLLRRKTLLISQFNECCCSHIPRMKNTKIVRCNKK